jgi:hypothetical protein
MVDVPDFIDVPIFGGSSSKIEPSPTIYANGFLPGQVFPAENENWFMNGLTGNGVTEQDSIVSLVTEMVNFLSAYSVTPNPALFNQFLTTFQAQLALKANLASPTFTGTVTIPTVPTPSSGGNPTTKTYVDSADTTLQNNINSEASTRSAADISLQADIDALAVKTVSTTTRGGTGVFNLPAMAIGEMNFIFVTGVTGAGLQITSPAGGSRTYAVLNTISGSTALLGPNATFMQVASGASANSLIVRLT